MTVHPPAKINIGLFVIEKRQDGFHNIETVFYPLPLHDILHIEATSNAATKLDFACNGIPLPAAEPHDNLCCKAFYLLDAHYGLPSVRIRLTKYIPSGAGMGGGSSDAAYTLLALRSLFHICISDSELLHLASHLGSDCAFFLKNSPALGTGRGDILEPLTLPLSGYYALLVKPPVAVSTADAYSSITPRKPQYCLTEALQAPINQWRNTVFNDFEATVFQKYPEIARIKEQLYDLGAVYAAMSGSGSAVYGIFDRNPEAEKERFTGCFVWSGMLA